MTAYTRTCTNCQRTTQNSAYYCWFCGAGEPTLPAFDWNRQAQRFAEQRASWTKANQVPNGIPGSPEHRRAQRSAIEAYKARTR